MIRAMVRTRERKLAEEILPIATGLWHKDYASFKILRLEEQPRQIMREATYFVTRLFIVSLAFVVRDGFGASFSTATPSSAAGRTSLLCASSILVHYAAKLLMLKQDLQVSKPNDDSLNE